MSVEQLPEVTLVNMALHLQVIVDSAINLQWQLWSQDQSSYRLEFCVKKQHKHVSI